MAFFLLAIVRVITHQIVGSDGLIQFLKLKYYTDNGFTLVKEETLECNSKSIGNWTFRMDL